MSESFLQKEELWVEEALELSREEQMEEFMFLGLRMKDGITRERFLQTFGISIDGVYLDVLEKLKQEEMIDTSGGRIALTDKGMDLSNYVLAHFLFD